MSDEFKSDSGVEPRIQFSLHDRLTEVFETIDSNLSDSVGCTWLESVSLQGCSLMITYFFFGLEQSGERMASGCGDIEKRY